MVSPVPETMIFAPNQLMSMMQVYTQPIMTGWFSEMIFSAETELSNSSFAAARNLLLSYSSRTNDFTTRIAPTFSLSAPLTTSYFLNICLK